MNLNFFSWSSALNSVGWIKVGEGEVKTFTTEKIQDVAHLEYQVDPADTEADEGALHEDEGQREEKSQGQDQKGRRQSKGVGADNWSALKIKASIWAIFSNRVIEYQGK